MAAILHTLDQRRLIDTNGIADGASIYFYTTGTLTPAAVYTTAALSVEHPSPISVAAGAAVPDIYLDSAVTYRRRIVYPDGSVDDTDPYNSGAALSSELASDASGKGAGLTKFSQASTYAAGTVGRRMLDLPFATDTPYNAATDGTDATTEVLEATDAEGAVVVPFNVRFTRADWLAGATVGDFVLDLGGASGFSDPGTTSKQLGITTKGDGPSDLHWYVASDHHPIFQLNNFGTAGSDSADARKVSLLWGCGEFANGDDAMRGYRSGAILQFTKVTGQTRWAYQLRCLAPWVAIAADYEFWDQGEVISGAGVYRFTGDYHYVSTGAGTCGATMPTHTSGTVSDGGVSWTYVDNADRSILNISEEGRILIGNGDLAATFHHKVSPADSSGDYLGKLAATGVSKDVLLKLIPTDGSANEASIPFMRANATAGWQIVASNGTTVLAAFSESAGSKLNELRFATLYRLDVSISGNATLTTTNRRVVYLTSAAATNLDSLSDGTDGQELRLVFLDGNCTVRHMNGNIHLTGAANQAFTAYSTLDLFKIPAGISDRWVEVARSVK